MEGDVLIQALVDTDGRIDMVSVRILQSTHDAFAQSVRAVLPEMRFTPATIEGCVARTLIQMPFAFRLRR